MTKLIGLVIYEFGETQITQRGALYNWGPLTIYFGMGRVARDSRFKDWARST